VLDPSKSISEVCKPVLDLLKEKQNSIRDISRYLLESRSKLKQGGLLEALLNRTEANEKKKNPNIPVDMEKLVSEKVDLIAKIKFTGFLCSLPIEALVSTFSKTLTLESIQEKRGDIMPMIVELLELVSEDKTEKGKKMNLVLLDMLKQMENLAVKSK
jgi:hypothetical protein